MQYTPAELLDIRGAADPDKEGIVVLVVDKPRQAIPFGDFKNKTEQLAAGLIRKGLQTGDRVALLCPHSSTQSVRIQDGDLDRMLKHQATIDSDMIHCCYCTFGSTGNPKFVAISGHWMTNSFRAFFKSERVRGDRGSTLLSDPIDIKVAKTGIGLDNEIKIIDENGVIVPVGTEEEVFVGSPFMFVEYLGDEEKTSQAKDSMGWYHTDDNGVLDENGYLTIHGRKSEVIIKATVKIYPSAIEKVIRKHTKIRQAVASGIPHPVIKEEICLCIVAESGADLTAEDVPVYCKEKFQWDETGSGSMPDYVLLFDKFPAGATAWKTERRKIRDEAVQRVGADREGCRL
ncbi:medium-chain acyl-CoA ligase ACSF2, mitochondrial-like [Lineus longissimus]|uniref:medium-chain acyl-CoA ligase ACSF2, mitochondrial-like n=1 Tax=Lineus longissimus TaxID=88925 RepID=UPI00315DBE29